MNRFPIALLVSSLATGCLSLSETEQDTKLPKGEYVHASGLGYDFSKCSSGKSTQLEEGFTLNHNLDFATLTFGDGYKTDERFKIPVAHFYRTENGCFEVSDKLSSAYVHVELDGLMYTGSRKIFDAKLTSP